MTPMIDIVFLLIIFFMTVSQITRTADVSLPLPRVTQGDKDAITSTITINLDEKGTIITGGEKLPLKSVLETIQKNLVKSDNDPSRIKVQIRCHRNCESRHVTALLEALAELGFTHVRSAVSDS